MKKKNLIVPAVALSIALGGAVIGGQIVSADTDDRTAFASKIAERFSLNSDEVTSFLEEARQERQAQGQENFKARLSEAVENGELTEDQMSLIIEKKEELRSEHEADRENDERPSQEEREAHQAELESWAEDNGIDMQYLKGGKGNGGPGGGHGHGPSAQ